MPGLGSNPAGVSSSRQSFIQRRFFCPASLLSPVPLCVRSCVSVSAHLLVCYTSSISQSSLQPQKPSPPLLSPSTRELSPNGVDVKLICRSFVFIQADNQVSCCCCHLHSRSTSPTQASFLSTLDSGHFCACMVDSLGIFFLPDMKRVKPSSSSGDTGCHYWFIPGSLIITARVKNTNKLTE